MPVKSNTLFHFTTKLDYLIDILENGFWPRYCLEDRSWLKKINPLTGKVYPQADDAYYPMVCFCDIPLSKILDHINFYGQYGIGLTKEWAVENHLNPLFYIADQSNHFPKIFMDAVDGYLEEQAKFESQHQTSKYPVSNQNLDNIGLFLSRLMCYMKPTQGKMTRNEQIIDKMFDEESEWRYIPAIEELSSQEIEGSLYKETLTDIVQQKNDKTNKIRLDFELNDIKYIFVQNDSEIPIVIEKLHKIFEKRNKKEDILLLSSKLVSIQTLKRDL